MPAALINPGQAFVHHEVMALIRGGDPLGQLNTFRAVGIDAANSRVLFHQEEGSLVRVRLVPGTEPITAIQQLAAESTVVWSAPNYTFTPQPDFIPNDPQFGQQYHLTKSQAPAAWDVTTGSPTVIVAIADDGIALNHPDLAASIWVNPGEIPGNGKDDDGNGFVDDVNGWDFYANDNNPSEENGDYHGTHVGGIVGARMNNGVGVASFAGGGPNGVGVRLMPIRFYGEGNGSGTTADIAAAFTYATNNGAKIINTSHTFDGFYSNPTLVAAVDYAYGKGVLMINSAGNNNQNNPSRRLFTQILFAAATDAADQRAPFSNYGRFVDIAAPGVNVFSTVWDNNNTLYTYRAISGTSMAAPNAAGVAALIWSANPSWTRDQVAAQLVGTADRIDEFNPGYEDFLGYGRINAFKAVTTSPPPPRIKLMAGLPEEGGFTTSKNFTIDFDAPLKFDPTTVSVSDFELRGDGADNIFGTADDLVVPLTLNGGLTYKIGTDGFALTFAGNLPVDRYRFTVKAAGLADPFGQILDGDNDGIAGGDFVRTFRVGVESIKGTVYEDLDVSLLFGSGNDPRLPGCEVYLDANNNGKYDGGETKVVTDALGNYAFLDLAPGSYTVRRITPSGWSDNRPASGFYSVIVTSSTSSSTGNHFGQLRTQAAYARVYEDLNFNGARDAADVNLNGRLVYVDLNNNGQLDSTLWVRNSTDVPKAVGLGTATSMLTVAEPAGVITDIDVAVTLNHTAVGDLTLTLIHPSGARIELMSRTGGETNNLVNTIFDDEATTAITGGVAPFTGRFKPVQRLVDLEGLSYNGTWTLEITDHFAASDSGTLTAWSLFITTGEPHNATEANGSVVIPGVPPGNWTLRCPPPTGWNPATATDVAITLSGLDPATGSTFGQWQQNAVYGRFYNDANGDGQLGTGESLLSGWRAYIDRNNNGQFDVPITNVASTNVPVSIKNQSTVTSKTTVSGINFPLTDLNVTVNITHSYTADLTLTLIAPDGRRVVLVSGAGTDGDNFTNTVFDDEAAAGIQSANAPFTGSFRPLQSLSLFDGMIPNGTWTLEIVDLMASNSGTLQSWSLAIETAEPNGISASHGGYVIPGLAAGVNTIRRQFSAPGWGGTQPVNDAYAISLSPGQSYIGNDFGQRQGPPRIAAVQVNDGSAQRSRVNELFVYFDRAVTFAGSPASAFQLVRTGPGAPSGQPDGLVPLAVTTTTSAATQTVARLTFSGALFQNGTLLDGSYQLRVVSGQVSENGQALDGDDNGLAGGDHLFNFHRLFGDIDGNGAITAIDFNAFRLAYGGTSAFFDADGDGQVTATDFNLFRMRYGMTLTP
jgi:subtilisin family serine protease/subtilisin-like proprotein convertase family protein